MKVKKEMEVLSRAVERAVLTPQEKVAVGRSLQRLAAIMAGYSDAGDKGVIGGYNGTFPLTAATAGNIYLEPKTGKYYRCETNYNGTQITGPNSNFVDLSVVANADRLNNLIYSKIWAGNHYINHQISTSASLGTLKIDHLNAGDILCLSFVNPEGDIAATALSIFLGLNKKFAVVVSASPNIIFNIIFRIDSNGNFYCENIRSTNETLAGIHILEIIKVSPNIAYFSNRGFKQLPNVSMDQILHF